MWGPLGGASHVSDTGGLLVILRLYGELTAPKIHNHCNTCTCMNYHTSSMMSGTSALKLH